MIIKDQVINKVGIPVLKNLMHITSTSQKLTAANVANVATPGFQSKSLDFQAEMQKAMGKQKIKLETTNARHMPPANAPKGIEIVKDPDDINSSGINNVDIDKEMATVAENRILYAYGSRMLASKFNSLKSVIRGKT